MGRPLTNTWALVALDAAMAVYSSWPFARGMSHTPPSMNCPVSQMVIVLKGTTLAFVLGGYFDLLRAATVLGAYYSRSLLQAQGIAAITFMLINIALSQIASAIDRKEKQRYGVQPVALDE